MRSRFLVVVLVSLALVFAGPARATEPEPNEPMELVDLAFEWLASLLGLGHRHPSVLKGAGPETESGPYISPDG